MRARVRGMNASSISQSRPRRLKLAFPSAWLKGCDCREEEEQAQKAFEGRGLCPGTVKSQLPLFLNHWSSGKLSLIGYQQLTFIHKSWGNPFIINPKLKHEDAPPDFLPCPPSHEKQKETFPSISSTFPCQCPPGDVFLFQLLWFSINMHHSARFYFKLHPSPDVPFEKKVISKYPLENYVLAKHLLQIAPSAIKQPWKQPACSP